MKSRILLIEDEPGLVLTITDLLTSEGFDVDSATDGVSGLARPVSGGHYLVDHRDRVVPREELLQNVWEYASEAASRTIDVHIAWLRQKLEDTPQNPKHIQTLRGKGYRFTA